MQMLVHSVTPQRCHTPEEALRYCHAATGSMIADASCMRQAAAVTAPTSGIDANTAPAELLTVSCTSHGAGVSLTDHQSRGWPCAVESGRCCWLWMPRGTSSPWHAVAARHATPSSIS